MGCLEDADCDPSFACVEFMCVSDGAIPEPPSEPEEPGDEDGAGPQLPEDLDNPVPEGDVIACSAQSDCDPSCTVCNFATNTCETCESGVLECAGGLSCAAGAAGR